MPLPNYINLPWRPQRNPLIMDGASGLTGEGPLIDDAIGEQISLPPAAQAAPIAMPSGQPVGMPQAGAVGAPPHVSGIAAPPRPADPEQMALAERAGGSAMELDPETIRLATTPPSTKRAILSALAGTFTPSARFAPLIAYGSKGLQARQQLAEYQSRLPRPDQAIEAQSKIAATATKLPGEVAKTEADIGNMNAQAMERTTASDANRALTSQRDASIVPAGPIAGRMGVDPARNIPVTSLEQGTRPGTPQQTRAVGGPDLATIAAGGFTDNPWKLTPEMAAKALDLQAKEPTAAYHYEVNDKGDLSVIDPRKGLVATVPGVGKAYHAPASQGAGLTDDAITQSAIRFLQTGTLPALGMGAGGDRQAILNRAAMLGGAQADVAGNSADYKATAGALNIVSRTRANVLAFENTANKNLDLALKASAKVSRTGSPLVNRIAQAVQSNAWGDPNLQAFHNAILTAANEYAKVVTGQTGGAAVSDAARREAQGLIAAAQTPEQFAAAVGIMKQEMENRRRGLDEELEILKGSIGTGAQYQNGLVAPPAPATGTFRVRRKSDGQTGTIDAKDFDPNKYEQVP